MSEYFLEPESSRTNVEVKLDLSNYATKTGLKNDIGKLETTPVDLRRLSNVVKKYVINRLNIMN